MNVLILVVNYFIEVIRFSMGLEIFFGKKMKASGSVAVSGIVYTLCLLWVEEIGPILLYIFACAAVYCMTEGRIGEKIFQILMVLCISGSLDEIIGIAIQHYVADYRYIRFLEAVIVLILFIFAREVQKRKPEFGMYITGVIKARVMITMLVMTIILSCIIVGFSNMQEYALKENFKLIADFISVLAFIGMIALLVFIAYIRKANEIMRELVDTERSLNSMQEKYYKELLKREEDTRRYRHDMQNHLLCLTQYIKNKEIEEGVKYIKGLQDNLVSIQKRCYISGNDLLDMFLNYYLSPLREVKINIWGGCSGSLLISEVDFCIIFSNLIQNVAEAMQRQKTGEKYIRIIIQERAEHCEFDIQNSIDSQTVSKDVTYKIDKKNHGIGLKNVSEAVQRNNGYFEAGIKNGEYSSIVILKRKKTVNTTV